MVRKYQIIQKSAPSYTQEKRHSESQQKTTSIGCAELVAGLTCFNVRYSLIRISFSTSPPDRS